MQKFSTSIGGVLLEVRQIGTGFWQASISGPSTLMDEETAKAQAVRFAASIIGNEIGPVRWDDESDLPK